MRFAKLFAFKWYITAFILKSVLSSIQRWKMKVHHTNSDCIINHHLEEWKTILRIWEKHGILLLGVGCRVAEWSGELVQAGAQSPYWVVAGSSLVAARSRGRPPPPGVIGEMTNCRYVRCMYVCRQINGSWVEMVLKLTRPKTPIKKNTYYCC